MSPGELVGIWESLHADCVANGTVVRRRVQPEATIDIFACAMPPDGQIGLLLEALVPKVRAFGLLPNCRGMRITGATSAGFADEHHLLLRIVLEDRRLLEVFSVLCCDLIGAAKGEGAPEAAMRTCLHRLLLWQGLIERMSEDGLAPEAQRGLFGELFALQSMLIPALGPDGAVVAWIGPNGGNQDFSALGLGVEVKTSIMKKPVRLRIANEKQLDDAGLRGLLLCHVSVVAAPMHGTTLPDLVESVRAALNASPISRELFDVQLTKAGYLESDKEKYDSIGYSVSAIDYYEVVEDFPRLVGSGVPRGLGDVSYSLAVDAISHFRIDPEEVTKRLATPDG